MLTNHFESDLIMNYYNFDIDFATIYFYFF